MKTAIVALSLIFSVPAMAATQPALDERFENTVFQLKCLDLNTSGGLSQKVLKEAAIKWNFMSLGASSAGLSVPAGVAGFAVRSYALQTCVTCADANPLTNVGVGLVPAALSSSAAYTFFRKGANVNEKYALNQDAVSQYAEGGAEALRAMFGFGAGEKAALKSAIERDLQAKLKAYNQQVAAGKAPVDKMPNLIQIALDAKYQGHALLAGDQRRAAEAIAKESQRGDDKSSQSYSAQQKRDMIALGTKLLEERKSNCPGVADTIAANHRWLEESSAKRRANGGGEEDDSSGGTSAPAN